MGGGEMDHIGIGEKSVFARIIGNGMRWKEVNELSL